MRIQCRLSRASTVESVLDQFSSKYADAKKVYAHWLT